MSRAKRKMSREYWELRLTAKEFAEVLSFHLDEGGAEDTTWVAAMEKIIGLESILKVADSQPMPVYLVVCDVAEPRLQRVLGWGMKPEGVVCKSE